VLTASKPDVGREPSRSYWRLAQADVTTEPPISDRTECSRRVLAEARAIPGYPAAFWRVARVQPIDDYVRSDRWLRN